MENIVKYGNDAVANGNYFAALNMFFVKDGETWVGCGGPAPDYPDITLRHYIRTCAKIIGDNDLLNLNDDDLDSVLTDRLMDGTDGVAANTLAVLDGSQLHCDIT